MRHKLDKTEQHFLAMFMGEVSEEKIAVDLDPSTAEALGIPTVSPAILDELEGRASSPRPAQPSGTGTGMASDGATDVEGEIDDDVIGAAAQELANQPEALEVAPFDAIDEEPIGDEPSDEDAVVPELPSRTTHGRLFGNKRAHPIDLLGVLATRYKDAWVDWEPATLWWGLRKDFGPIGEVTRNKIGALRVAVATDLPWQDWDTFENCSLAWNDLVPLIGVFQPISPSQAAFGVSILHAIRDDEVFRNEVNAYIAAILDEDGWVFAPPEYFGGAQELLDRKVWLAGLRHDVEQAWEKIKDVDPTTVEWNHGSALDIHLIKLMAVKHYVQERNAMQGRGIGVSASASAAQPPVPQ